ncbi:hypothetical protein [Metabacillus litoralis]|uniref:Uncharacterized protein n=1 Tax=Metabacillus litoralis TaxID=152268 RepID=A0A179SW73_9BACI|nr:hypothetical protein [Metabacillus litoralis]OAS85109.1 hypothetical protein A6K24_06250 [Metabacillus litoralis]
MYYNPNLLFTKGDLSSYLTIRKNNIADEIRREEENYLLNVGEQQYTMHLKSKHEVDYLELHTEKAYAEPKEENIRAEDFPNRFLVNVYDGKSYPKQVYYFYIPYSGSSELLIYRPSTFTLSPPRAYLQSNYIVLRYVQFNETVDDINKEYESFIRKTNDMIGYVNKDLNIYNNSLEQFILTIFRNRKEELLKRRDQYSSLAVPIKKKEDVSLTFSIPSPEIKKKIEIKPVIASKDFKPDPTLNEGVYMDILKIINDMGKEFERKPSVYGSKGEEDLRDHFLMLLEPHFDGSATGETFNKSGKTDILLRYQGDNVFVGECKFWTGKKGFLKTINQLLGYLTWRDSKTAVIMFVSNKDFTSVVETARESIQEHPNYIKYINDSDESWSNYSFHLNGNENKEIKLALMLYHTSK